MAQLDLKNITKIDKVHNYVHQKVQATYTIFEIEDERFVQIDTYGKSGREFPGKISQSIQIDNDSALYLINLLKNEFNL